MKINMLDIIDIILLITLILALSYIIFIKNMIPQQNLYQYQQPQLYIPTHINFLNEINKLA